MSNLKCKTCGNTWDAALAPTCPVCQANRWAQSPSLIKPKHNPALLPSACDRFRTVVSYEVAASPSAYLSYAAASGNWFYHQGHKKWFNLSVNPFGSAAGSPIRPGDPMPYTAYDSLIVADANGTPHLFAEDSSVVRQKTQMGTVLPVQSCSVPGCKNLSVPDDNKCARHCQPPLAN